MSNPRNFTNWTFYDVFCIHVHIRLFGLVFFFDFGMPWAVRFLLICLIIPMISLTHFLSLFSSLYFVESTFLDFFLHVTDNGRIARKNQHEAWILNTNETSDRGKKK